MKTRSKKMKITKQRIIQMIREEMQNATAGEPDETVAQPEDPANSRSALAAKFKEIASKVLKMQGIDAAESQIIDQFINNLLNYANDENGQQKMLIALKKANDIFK